MPPTELAPNCWEILGCVRNLFDREAFRARVPSYRKDELASIVVYPVGASNNVGHHKLLISTGFPPQEECLESIEIWMWTKVDQQPLRLGFLGNVPASGQLCFNGGEPGQRFHLAATCQAEEHATLVVPDTDQRIGLARDKRRLWTVVSEFAERCGGADVWTVRAPELAPSPAAMSPTSPPATFEVADLAGVAKLCLRASDGATQAIDQDSLRSIRRTLRRRVRGDLALHDVRDCGSVAAVLEWLLPEAQRLGLTNIRFYPLSHDIRSGYRLCSHSSAGHEPRTAHRLGVGQIIKFLDKSPLDNHDSFWSVVLGVPTVFILDDGCQRELECYVAPEAVPLVRVHENRCMNVLVRHRSDAWVDIPLFGGVIPTGKLSCDFQGPVRIRDGTTGAVDQDVNDRVLQFNEIAQLVAARLDVLYRQDLERHALLPSPEEVGSQISDECDTSDALERFCTEQIPRILNCEYGSILTISRDSLRSELLVFRKTSFSKSRHEECVSTYALEENALTSWVARSGRSICLQDLGDPDLRRDKLREYDPYLHWANKIQDSDNHGDLLIVPVFCKGQVVAVVRYTQRRAGHFTENEQRWLEQICRRYVGPKLECLWRQSSDALLDKYSQQIAAISVLDSVTSADTPREIAQQFGNVIQEVFPGAPGRKAILVNVVDEDQTHFVHHAVINNLDAAMEERYELKGSLTGFAFSHPGIVFINDLEKAAAGGHYRPVFRDAVCALACRIGLSDRPYGALVVLSNRHDISDRVHGAALKLVAERAGEILYRREVKALLFEDGSRAAGLKVALRRIEEIIGRNKPTLTEQDRHEAEMLVPLAEQMVDALTQIGPTNKDFTKNFRQFRVREAVARAASLIPHEEGRLGLKYSIDPKLWVTAQEGFFVTILCGLLRNAWNFSRKVSVSATPRRGANGEQWLDICVESLGRRRSLQSSWDDQGILESLSLGRYAGLTTSRSLARWYRLPDGRSGDICVNEGNRQASYRCTFQLPVATEAPSPSNC